MTKFVYVLPNLSSMKQRGGIAGRLGIAKEINTLLEADVFKVVEVPGDFVKNGSEVRRTGLSLCSALDSSSVVHLYDRETEHRPNYVLHTEPSLPRTTETVSCTPPLKWYDSSWVGLFKKHIYPVIDHLGGPPSTIEVHPGSAQNGRNSVRVLLNGIRSLSDGLFQSYGSSPVFNLENRTGHVVSRGKEIQAFRETVEPSELTDIRIALDIQQSYTQTKQDFQNELTMIPTDAIGCFHIHQLHRVPRLGGSVDWHAVRDYIQTASLPSIVHVLPEVHHAEHLCATYRFCRDFLGL